MDKIVLDAFKPTDACYQQPDPGKPDDCTVEVTFHNREDPASSQPTLKFQREKSNYIFAPGNAAVPVVQSLGFNEKSLAVQSALNFAVFLHGWPESAYPKWKTDNSYSGPDLLPLSKKVANFVSSGDIENPDSVQRKNTSAVLRDLLMLSDQSKVWFSGIVGSLNDPKKNQKVVPLPMRPRVEWVLDQMETFQKLRSGLSSLSEPTPENKALQSDVTLYTVDLLDYLTTGQGSPQKLRENLEDLAKRTWGQATAGELKDLFAYFRKKLEPLLKDSFYKGNPDAQKRLVFMHLSLKNSELEHRAELLGSDPATAFKKGIQYRLQEAALKSHLASRVKDEMDKGDLSVSWLQNNIGEIAKALAPYFRLESKQGQPSRVAVDAKGLTAAAEKLIADHEIREREYVIGTLAALRYLLGPSFSDFKMDAWIGDRYTEVEIQVDEAQARQLRNLHDTLVRKIKKSVKQTSIFLPLGEGILAAGGGAIAAYGLSQGKEKGRPFIIAGAAGLGAGVGALSCHFFLPSKWQIENQYWTDLICGVAAGVGTGVAASFIFKPDDRPSGPPPGPRIDSRDPNTPGGGGQCKPPDQGCGP